MLSLVTGPTDEPVSLADVKEHLRISHTQDDAQILALIQPARQYCESFTQRAFMTQTWSKKFDYGFPCSPIRLPKAPLLSSTPPVVTYLDSNGDSQTWASSNYTVDYPSGPHAERGRIRVNYGVSYPTTRAIENAVTIQFVCGYGAATAVPEMIKFCIKEHVRATFGKGTEDPAATMDWIHRQLFAYVSY